MIKLLTFILLGTAFNNVIASELSGVDIARINKFSLIAQSQQDIINNQIRITSKRIPVTFKEKIQNLRAGGDDKALNCIEIRRMYKIQQTLLNKYLQFHHEVGLYKKLSYQRFSLYDKEIGEYKSKALEALNSCRDFETSKQYMSESKEHLEEARKILFYAVTRN